MEIVIEGEAAAIVERLVATGRFSSAREAVEDALRRAGDEADDVVRMRTAVQDALDEGGEYTMADVEQELEQVFRQLEKDHP